MAERASSETGFRRQQFGGWRQYGLGGICLTAGLGWVRDDPGQARDQDQGLRPNGLGFAFGELLDKAPSNQGLVLLVWPLLRRGSFTPVSLRGPAAIRHPWRGAALAASMRLGPLRETCVQPAPKSRWAVFGLFVYGDQELIKSKSRANQVRIKSEPKPNQSQGNSQPLVDRRLRG
jgi:hypothetical protein